MATITVDCPVCEEQIELEVNYTPGIAPSGMSGPPENYDPGCGDEVELEGDAPKACPECKTVWTPEQKNEFDISIEKALENYEHDSSEDDYYGPERDDDED